MSFNQYIQTALWSSSDNNDTPMDENFSISDLAPETHDYLKELYDNFWSENQEILCEALDHTDEDRIDHLLWLTHNGHGAGFFDGDYPNDLEEKLMAAADKLPEINLYVGDDGQIYHF